LRVLFVCVGGEIQFQIIAIDKVAASRRLVKLASIP
jgi:hypothetical protein